MNDHQWLSQQRSEWMSGPVGNWIFDLIPSQTRLAHHLLTALNSNYYGGIHPGQFSFPLTIIMSRHRHSDSGTIPSMMAVQDELKDNTLIVGK